MFKPKAIFTASPERLTKELEIPLLALMAVHHKELEIPLLALMAVHHKELEIPLLALMAVHHSR